MRRAQLPPLELAGSASDLMSDQGVVTSTGKDTSQFVDAFVAALARHRHWERDRKDAVPA